MVAWIPAGGKGDVKVFLVELFPERGHFDPGPGIQVVFAIEGGPGRVEGNDFDCGPEARLQIRGIGFGEEGDVELLGGLAEERCGNGQIAHAPEFDDE